MDPAPWLTRPRQAVSSQDFNRADMSHHAFPLRATKANLRPEDPSDPSDLGARPLLVSGADPASSDSDSHHTGAGVCHGAGVWRWADVESQHFQFAVGVLVMANMVVQGCETYYGEGHFSYIEFFFTVMFTVEIAFRLMHHGCPGYCRHSENWFDMFLIGGSWLCLLLWLCREESLTHVNGVLPMLRTFRVMRVLRLFTLFHDLNILLAAFGEALRTIAWVGLMAVAINYMCAVFLTSWVKTVNWGDDGGNIAEWFGTLGYSMRTLFFVMTLAQYDDIVLVMEKHVNHGVLYAIVIIYIVVTAFGMVSLITGIISEKLVSAQMTDLFEKQQQLVHDQQVFAAEAGRALKKLDDDGDGFISVSDVKNADVRHLQSVLVDLQCIADLQMTNAEFATFVDHVTDLIGVEEPRKGNVVEIDSLAEALGHVRGYAQALKLWEYHEAFDRFRERAERRLEDLAGGQDELRRKQDEIMNSQSRMGKQLEILLSASGHGAVAGG
uniref:EF-hand domain-containing protein n=1 Tax=Zooxanthella nutricula TaxID=1333877 RepID=A0A7S2IKW7_9DINO|mmetsp:Transcript_18921/g.56580  ORF Transcript_18921/g.56580 Transcript_18921/m.56580 type:complete len:496 (+) Transcript_18921:2-1489(+)